MITPDNNDEGGIGLGEVLDCGPSVDSFDNEHEDRRLPYKRKRMEMRSECDDDDDDDDEVTSRSTPLLSLSSLIKKDPDVATICAMEPLSSLVEVASRERPQILEPSLCRQSSCTSCVSVRQDLFLPDYSRESAVDIDDNECMRRALIELRSSIESETDDSITAAMILDEVNEVIDNINNKLVTKYAKEIYYEAINTVGVQILDAYSLMHSFLVRCVAVGHADLDADLVAQQIQMEEAKGAIGIVVAC